ncbi:8-oxoguanine DNA glycosylase OGG fold protein [Corynebacterium hadale]
MTIAEALHDATPTPEDVAADSSTFSPIRWKTGWPHHLRRVPPFRADATASLTRRDVFLFAQDVVDSEYNRDQIIDFLGAAFAFAAGQSNQVMQLQQFLRNKHNANQLLQAIRNIGGKSAVDAYASLVETGLAPKFASHVAYFLAGPQEASDEKPVIICSKRAVGAGLSKDADWTADDYAEYLTALREARDAHDSSLPLDAVEYALRKHADV